MDHEKRNLLYFMDPWLESKPSRVLGLAFVLLIPFFALACFIPGLLTDIQTTPAPITPQPAAIVMVSVPANATSTPTPFMPMDFAVLSNTQVLTTTPVAGGPPWGDYPGPTVNPDIEIPPPAGLLPQPPGQFNVLLMGSDQRQGEGGFRTDTMILVSINPQAGTATLTSFPRDLYVYIPGWTMQRLNTAHAHGGFPLTQLTFEYNFGVRPDRYVMINFWGFSQLINSLNGIYINAAQPHSDHRDRYGTYSIPAGSVYMDGPTALWYVRSRYTSSDFDRTRRQQEVILGLFYRLLSLDALQKAPELYDIYKQNVTMDLSFEDLQPFLPLAAQLGETENIRNFYIGSENVINYRTSGGAAVLLPQREEIVEIMGQALSSPE